MYPEILDFGCFEVADSENWFSRFSTNSGDLSKNKLHHVQLLVNSYHWANCEQKSSFWLWPRNFDFAQYLQEFSLKHSLFRVCIFLHSFGTSSFIFVAFLQFLSYYCASCVLKWVLGQHWASCGCLACLSWNGALCLLCVGACLLPCPAVLGR